VCLGSPTAVAVGQGTGMSTDTKARSTFLSDIWDIAKIIVQALALALVVRVFLFQPFNIPSGSMENTLLIGDYIFVSKYSYGYSKYSFVFDWPPFQGRILQGLPKRGDVAVFRKPADTSVDYIKRVIGLPGDEIQMQDGVLYINGKAVPKVPAEPYLHNGKMIERFQETLPDGVSYFVLDEGRKSFDSTGVYKVPPGAYFMMGDNRDNSSDSRDPSGGVGFVPLENFIGKAQIVFYSNQPDLNLTQPWSWPWHVRWDRIFRIVS
jgi:signal peptidase I